MRKFILGFIITSMMFGGYFVDNFLRYSTAYGSFSFNTPRYQDDRFSIVGGLTTGQLEIEREHRELKPDFQKSFGLRKIGRFKYEARKGVKAAGVGGEWYDGSEKSYNEKATIGPVRGWEYLLKWTQGRQWGDDYLNQEYWLKYNANLFVAKAGYTQLDLEDVEYTHYDVRLKKDIWDFTISAGLKHRQHPAYGFDAMVLDTTWYLGTWWTFAEDAFGWDDEMWFIEDYYVYGDQLIQLYQMDPDGGVMLIDGGGPFWNDDGTFMGVDWLWYDEDGNLEAYTDREFFLYHFPELLEEYMDGVIKDLGNQKETSIVIGLDLYHHSDNWWLHAWGNWLPYHYGHDKYSYHNAKKYLKHIEDKKPAHEFEFGKPGWKDWTDYDFGAIIGVKLKENVGVFAEGNYLNYWERPAYSFKVGLNYQFAKFN